MTRFKVFLIAVVALGILPLCLVNRVSAQQLPPGITLEQLNQLLQLLPQQRAELLRLLQQAGITAIPLSLGETGMQLPEEMIPIPDTSRGITKVDTTQFFIENLFDFGLVAGEFDSTHVLELFGRRIFQQEAKNFDPSMYGPVGAAYTLGPGDQVIIQIWGSYQKIHDLTINREGYVLIPDVGQVALAYLTLEQARHRLYQFLTPSHQALNYNREGATASLDISLGKLRSIRVFVLGEVQRPRAYTLSSVSTIFMALYAAGGPTNKGSLRDIRLVRGTREFSRFDAYDYLLRGDSSRDTRLEDGDIVFVYPIGPQVMVQGRVRRPAVYEIRSGETLKDILSAGGGITASARLDRAQVARILPPDERGATPWTRVFIDVDLQRQLDDLNPGLPLVDGDVLTVFPITDDQRDFVVVEGAVWNEGRLQWTAGMMLRDAIVQSGGLREEALTSRVEIIRTHPDERTEQISVVLEQAMAGDPGNNLTLERRDRIHVPSIHDIYPRKNVNINGQIQHPGEYLLHERMTIMDLIVRAGGFTKDAVSDWVTIVRMRPPTGAGLTEFETRQVPIDTTYAPQGPNAFFLEDFDQVFIRRKPKWEVRRNITLQGEVLYPGLYALQRDDEKVADLIERAGGLTPYAYVKGARYYREFEDVGRINIDLKRALEDPRSITNIVMQPGDSLYVPPQVEFVMVQGEVGYPSSVLYMRGRGPKYYIGQAGGFAENAARRHTRVTLPNGSTWRPRWFLLPNPEVEPGSVIFVPEKAVTARNPWEIIRDTASIVASFTTVLLLLWQITK